MPAPFDSPAALAIVCGIFGLLIGSFLNVVIYRLPVIMKRGWAKDASEYLTDPEIQDSLKLTDEDRAALKIAAQRTATALAALPPMSIAKPRSTCPHCGHKITALENVPIISYLVLRGRCSSCKAPISARYPIIEAVVALLFAAAGWRFGEPAKLVLALVIISILVSLTMIDADTLLLPDSLTLSLLWLAIIADALGIGLVPLFDGVIGAAAGYLVFWLLATGFKLLRGIEGMGGGDFKLLAALGACFGWSALLPIVLLSAGVGSVVGIGLMLARRATMLSRLPFGVYLAPAGVIMLFFGAALIALITPSGDF
jgi:leader peptidase (prepilin peptidase)/N-methyltransferase